MIAFILGLILGVAVGFVLLGSWILLYFKHKVKLERYIDQKIAQMPERASFIEGLSDTQLAKKDALKEQTIKPQSRIGKFLD